MVNLPEKYCDNMKKLLQEEYMDYIDSMSKKTYSAIRINTKKISVEEWEKINPFVTEPIAWTNKGFYLCETKQSDGREMTASKHPYYYAGLYYIQEPSAMIPASLLPVEKEDKVLDLCAAPGGKATELGAKLNGHGLLVANDISVSRTMALAKNLQMAGIENCLVTAETPKHLAEVFSDFFDKILIDAPCSGEGMFRREPRMVKDWEEKGPAYYADIQKDILKDAYYMLKKGGKMVYSTCTFSVQEDEAVVQWFLDTFSDMRICPVERKEGFSEGRPDMIKGSDALKHCVRIFPHKAKGEGHFAVLLEKLSGQSEKISLNEREENGLQSSIERLKEKIGKAEEQKNFRNNRKNAAKEKYSKKAQQSGRKRKENLSQTSQIDKSFMEIKEILEKLPFTQGTYDSRKNVIYLRPLWTEGTEKLRIVHQGLEICECKQKINLSHQLALCLTKEDYSKVWNLSAEDERVIRYLKGETLQAEEAYTGNVLVCVDGYGLGWCRGNGSTTLKNKYYPGWRYQ